MKFKDNFIFRILTSLLYFRNSFVLPYFNDKIEEKVNQTYLNKEIIFIQIGVNDGYLSDNILNSLSKNSIGYLIEPNLSAYQTLIKKEDFNNYKIFNLAISNEGGIIKLYKLNFTDEPLANGLITSDINVLLSHFKSGFIQSSFKQLVFEPPYSQYIGSFEVKKQSLDAFILKNSIRKLDLLMIDTEGHEYTILNSFSFKVFPKMVFFESCHFKSFDQYFSLCKRFKKNGYKLETNGTDILAYKV